MTITIAYIVRILGDQIETDRHGVLTCSDVDCLNDLKFYSRRKEPVTLGFDESSRRIRSVSSAPSDALIALSPRDVSASRIVVQLMKRPSMLYLDKSHPRFDVIYEQLHRALIEKTWVILGVLPGDDQIEDVRSGAAEK